MYLYLLCPLLVYGLSIMVTLSLSRPQCRILTKQKQKLLFLQKNTISSICTEYRDLYANAEKGNCIRLVSIKPIFLPDCVCLPIDLTFQQFHQAVRMEMNINHNIFEGKKQVSILQNSHLLITDRVVWYCCQN